MYEKTVKKYVTTYDLINVPLEQTTTEAYEAYRFYCMNHSLVAVTKSKFTRELRRYGYERISARFGDKVTKVYRFTNKVHQECPECKGKGFILIDVNL